MPAPRRQEIYQECRDLIPNFLLSRLEDSKPTDIWDEEWLRLLTLRMETVEGYPARKALAADPVTIEYGEQEWDIFVAFLHAVLCIERQ